MTVVEWAEKYRHLSRDNTAEAGPYRYARAPYLREIAEAFTDPTVEKIVVRKSAQVGFTEGVIGNAIGFVIDMDPSPILMMQPTLDDAARWSKKKLMPMVRASPRLRAKVGEARPGDARNTIHLKTGLGWSLSIVGAKSPRQMRSDSIRFFFADERSGYDRSAGVEGDPFLLGLKRTTTFDNRTVLVGSTPTVKPDPIDAEYENSDQREYEVPCPHCGGYQTLRWENLRWDKEGEGLTRRHLPETAHFVCVEHGCVIEEKHKRAIVQQGVWVPRNPGHPVRGYSLWQAISLFAKAGWKIIAAEWLEAQGDLDKLKNFYNTVRGESFEERGERPDADALSARREAYAAEVPMGVAVLTASVDVQDDRLEFLVKGWGANEESWLIAHHRIWGDPRQKDVWKKLDVLRTRRYRHESGVDLVIQVTCVDSSDKTDVVYDYVKPRQRQRVYAVKGHKGKGRPVFLRPGKAKDKSVRLFIVGADTAKDKVLSRLRIAPPAEGERAKPGYMHFPMAQEDGADELYLKQFENESPVPRRNKRTGEIVRTYVQRGPNEAIDLEVYALVGLHILGDAIRRDLGAIAARFAKRAAARKAAPPAPDPALPPVTKARPQLVRRPPAPPKRSGFVNRWRK
jgi:phage terminase large subunit GpA-like protein